MTRECHKCPHYGHPTEACITCEGPADISYKGRDCVFIDALPAADELVEEERLERREPSTERDPNEGVTVTDRFTADMEDALRKILATYMALDPIDRLIFDLIFHGSDMANAARSLSEIGQRVRNVTKQAVFKRVKAMATTNPEIYRCIRSMIRDGSGGAVKKADRHPQMEFKLGAMA